MLKYKLVMKMKNKRILYMGTPVFSQYILEKLIENGFNVIGLVSQPDRPVGRKKIITPTPTKEVALKYGLPIYQPERIKDDYEFIKELNPDVIITCAYGQFVPQGLLDIPPFRCINIHASLLPKLRGGAPIQHALIDGFDKTGVTLMEMIKKMDAGRMYAKVETEITDEDTYDSLHDRLKVLGAELILNNLELYLEGKLEGIPQDENEVTISPNISKEEEHLDFNKTSREVFNHIRGLSSIPGAHFKYNNEAVKVYKSRIIKSNSNEENGTIINVSKDSIDIKTSDGAIGILEFQLQGKTRIKVKDYLNGNNKFQIGTKIE